MYNRQPKTTNDSQQSTIQLECDKPTTPLQPTKRQAITGNVDRQMTYFVEYVVTDFAFLESKVDGGGGKRGGGVSN